IATQLLTQGNHGWIVSQSLGAAVSAVVLIGTVSVVFAVRLVVLALIADDVGEGEAVMDGDMIDTRSRAAAALMEQISGAGQAAPQLTDEAAIAAPVASQYAAELVVPFRPAGRKTAHLVAAQADVPRFRDKFHVGQNRVLTDGPKKCRAAIEAARSSAQRRCQIEPESVDVADLHPVAK